MCALAPSVCAGSGAKPRYRPLSRPFSTSGCWCIHHLLPRGVLHSAAGGKKSQEHLLRAVLPLLGLQLPFPPTHQPVSGASSPFPCPPRSPCQPHHVPLGLTLAPGPAASPILSRLIYLCHKCPLYVRVGISEVGGRGGQGWVCVCWGGWVAALKVICRKRRPHPPLTTHPPSLPPSVTQAPLSHGAKDTCPHPKPGMWTELQSVD